MVENFKFFQSTKVQESLLRKTNGFDKKFRAQIEQKQEIRCQFVTPASKENVKA